MAYTNTYYNSFILILDTDFPALGSTSDIFSVSGILLRCLEAMPKNLDLIQFYILFIDFKDWCKMEQINFKLYVAPRKGSDDNIYSHQGAP